MEKDGKIVYIIKDDKDFGNIQKILEYFAEKEGLSYITKTFGVEKITQSEIFTLDCIFEKGNAFNKTKSIETEKFRFDENGATWFSNFQTQKDKPNDDGMTKWKAFIENITEKVHKKYSFLEYIQKATVDTSKERKFVAQVFADLKKIFYEENRYQFDINIEESQEKDDIDVYGATIKMAIADSGAERIVLGKLVFKQNKNGELVPCDADYAKSIVNSLSTFEDDDEQFDVTSSDESLETKNKIGVALKNFFALNDQERGEKDIANNIYIFDKEDNEVIEDMIENGPSKQVKIECVDAKLLSIFHCKWEIKTLDVSDGYNKLFSFKFGFENQVQVKCLCCNEYLFDEKNSLSKNYTYDELKEKFGDHVFVSECGGLNIQNPLCRKMICKSTSVELYDRNNNKYRICKDCEYPEVATKIDGKTYLTKTLVFDPYSMQLVVPESDGSNIAKCDCCGREFVVDNMLETGGYHYCKLCQELQTIEFSEVKSQNEKFKQYAYMLPMGIFYKSKGRCVEDEEIIMFKVGTNFYKFDKLQIGQGRYFSLSKLK